ncbi:MAG: Uncharacterised protein [Synechococcus sp. CC9902]|nr:MAG: Uncharacterised protein [Synechococcus sp. CC9902]
MQFQAVVTQLQHGSQHSETPTGLRCQQIQCGKHRLRGGVVGLIQDSEPTLLQLLVATTGHRHLQGLKLSCVHSELASNSNGKQQIAGVMSTLQR